MFRVVPFLVCFFLAILLGMVAVSLSSRGHPVALPLDDAYIYLQYARTAIEGSWGEYHAGEGTSTGATSLLWSALLVLTAGVLQVLGKPLVTGLPFAALALSTATVGLTFHLMYRMARHNRVGQIGAMTPHLLLILTPYWFFGGFNGMETGLYGATLLGGAWALSGGSVWWLLPLALARPEGSVLALILLAFLRISRARKETGSTSWSTTLAYRVVPVAVAAALLGPLALSGHSLSAWEAKAVWTEPDPALRDFHFPRIPWLAGKILLFGIQGAKPAALESLSDLFHPESLGTLFPVVFLGGGAILAVTAGRGRALLVLWMVASVAALGALAWDAHFYRYVIPAFPLLAVSAAVGWFGRRQQDDSVSLKTGKRWWIFPALGGLCLAGILVTGATGHRNSWTTLRWLYRGQCERMVETHIRLGEWIAASLPPDARVATHDVGAIAFHGRHPVVDLVGLVTPGMAGAYRQGEGAIWEALEAMPPRERPTHAAVIPAWMPYLTRSRWSGQTRWKQNPNPSQRSPVSQDFEVWELSWPDTHRDAWPGGDFGRIPRGHGIAGGKPGWIVVDAVDIADLNSERVHEMEGPRSSTLVRTLGFVRPNPRSEKSVAVDGGREVAWPVSFSMGVKAGMPALLVLRCTSTQKQSARITIGEWSGTLEIPRGEEQFHEPAILLPPQALAPEADGRVRIRIEEASYRAFHWWILQPNTNPDRQDDS